MNVLILISLSILTTGPRAFAGFGPSDAFPVPPPPRVEAAPPAEVAPSVAPAPPVEAAAPPPEPAAPRPVAEIPPPAPATPAVVPSAYPTRVCFAPQEACEKQLIKLIQSAKHTLDVAVYHVNADKIARRIAQKAKQIAVRVVTDEGQTKIDHSLAPKLAQAGVNVRYGKQRGIFHHQFVIVDGVRVETGSFNFTTHAFTENQENQIYTSEASVIERYQNQFEKIWAAARPYTKAASPALARRGRRTSTAAPAREVASQPAPAPPAPVAAPSPPAPAVEPPAPSDW